MTSGVVVVVVGTDHRRRASRRDTRRERQIAGIGHTRRQQVYIGRVDEVHRIAHRGGRACPSPQADGPPHRAARRHIAVGVIALGDQRCNGLNRRIHLVCGRGKLRVVDAVIAFGELRCVGVGIRQRMRHAIAVRINHLVTESDDFLSDTGICWHIGNHYTQCGDVVRCKHHVVGDQGALVDGSWVGAQIHPRRRSIDLHKPPPRAPHQITGIGLQALYIHAGRKVVFKHHRVVNLGVVVIEPQCAVVRAPDIDRGGAVLGHSVWKIRGCLQRHRGLPIQVHRVVVDLLSLKVHRVGNNRADCQVVARQQGKALAPIPIGTARCDSWKYPRHGSIGANCRGCRGRW